MKSFTSSAIVNIARVEIITHEATPRVLTFTTVSSAEQEPFVSKGEETELRIKNRIVAQDCLEDIVKGYNITLKDCALTRDLLAVIDGGSARTAAAGVFSGYDAPAAGAASARVHFDMAIYAEEKDYSGETTAYYRFEYPDCVGTPCKMEFENGVFSAPEYEVRSRSSGNYSMRIQCLDTLPVICAQSTDAPADPVSGDCVIASAAFTLGSVELSIGDLAYYTENAWVKIP